MKSLKTAKKKSDDSIYKGVRKAHLQEMLRFSGGRRERDADGYFLSESSDKLVPEDTAAMQQECWKKFHDNPQLNTAVRGLVGRLTGNGFKVSSPVPDIQDCIDEIEYDHRNCLWKNYTKYVGRHIIEGELFLSLTLHKDGFVEVDFIDPACIPTGKGHDGTGIVYHPSKTSMPLFYYVQKHTIETNKTPDPKATRLIPSINIARFPELLKELKKYPEYAIYIKEAQDSSDYGFKRIGGFSRFIVEWNSGFMTRRSSGHLRTTLKWMNYYEQMKRLEMDHKKSLAAYAWAFEYSDRRLYDAHVSLEKAGEKTIASIPIKPGQRVALPPGIALSVKAPQLPSNSGQDTDILDMVSSGLNEPQDITTGVSSGTFASVKASRGPMSDRISDEIAYFRRWLIFDFWSAIFFLKSSIGKFPKLFGMEKGVAHDKDKEILTRTIQRPAEFFVKVSFPVSENIDYAGRVSAGLGVKHASLVEGLGLPKSFVAELVGVADYESAILEKALEDRKYPKLALTADQEAVQEALGAEPSSDTLVNREIRQNDNSEAV